MEKPATYSFADSQIEAALQAYCPAELKVLAAEIDWKPLQNILDRHYRIGKQPNGRYAHPSLTLFRMLLLAYLYNLSDAQTENQVGVNLAYRYFVGLSLSARVPDHTRICRFRNHLAEAGAFDELLAEVNRQLRAMGLTLKPGTMVDATITRSAARHNDNNDHDPHADYTRKNGETHYGYKAHTATDGEGLVQAIVTTGASQHDGPMLINVLNAAQAGGHELGTVHADKGYDSQDNRLTLEFRKADDGIMRRVWRSLSKEEASERRSRNRVLQQARYVVERTFGSCKRWFGGGRSRYVGMDRVHGFHVLLAIAYNLKRLPGLLIRVG